MDINIPPAERTWDNHSDLTLPSLSTNNNGYLLRDLLCTVVHRCTASLQFPFSFTASLQFQSPVVSHGRKVLHRKFQNKQFTRFSASCFESSAEISQVPLCPVRTSHHLLVQRLRATDARPGALLGLRWAVTGSQCLGSSNVLEVQNSDAGNSDTPERSRKVLVSCCQKVSVSLMFGHNAHPSL